ncbi:MAG: cell division protein FtsL [Rhodobacteraceae bacterium]|nr:cell division protein FtsL [Paracoccaceae bacterium]
MKTFMYLLAGVLVVFVASWTYKVNYQVQEAEDRVSSLQRQINRERSAIAVLGAEWAYLNRPERLRALSEAYYTELRLMPIDASHFAEISEVPMPLDEIGAAVQQIVARTY